MMRGYWDYPGGGPFGHHLGGVGIAGMILMIILWIAVIAAIVIGIRALVLHSRRNRAQATAVPPAGGYPAGVTPGPVAAASAPALLTILEERYARGEITREDFLQRKQDLGLSGTVPAAPAAATPPVAPAPEAQPPATS
jgi:uncharacterized membrane protein